MVWVKFAVGVATGTAIHTGWRGDNIYEVVGWSALTGGISTLLSSGRFWGTAWGGVRAAGPPLWILAKDVAFVVRGTAGLIAQTRTAQAVAKGGGALGAGYVLGAAVGTGVIYVAEKKGIVYEGATTDVARFYTGGGNYWGDYNWKGQPKSGPVSVFINGKLVSEEPMPGYFNAPGNIGIIADHVKHGHYFGH